jgi:hypothetical protein
MLVLIFDSLRVSFVSATAASLAERLSEKDSSSEEIEPLRALSWTRYSCFHLMRLRLGIWVSSAMDFRASPLRI